MLTPVRKACLPRVFTPCFINGTADLSKHSGYHLNHSHAANLRLQRQEHLVQLDWDSSFHKFWSPAVLSLSSSCWMMLWSTGYSINVVTLKSNHQMMIYDLNKCYLYRTNERKRIASVWNEVSEWLFRGWIFFLPCIISDRSLYVSINFCLSGM